MWLLTNILLVSSVGFYAVALLTVHQLIQKLPPGDVRSNWKILSFFILGLIVAYINYLVLMWMDVIAFTGITLPVVCFSIAAFTLLLCFLTYQTTRDIKEAIAIEQASIIDPNLEIYNRRYFDRRIEEELQRANRYKLPLSLLLFSIDQYEAVLKQHGNLVGDVVLRKVSDFISNAVRSSDIVARFDKDKIIVATTQTEEEMAEILANRLRSDIEQIEVPANEEDENESPIQITTSIGVCSAMESITSGYNLMELTENALKHASVKGNSVHVFDPVEADVSADDVAHPIAA